MRRERRIFQFWTSWLGKHSRSHDAERATVSLFDFFFFSVRFPEHCAVLSRTARCTTRMEWTEREAGRRWRQSLCLYLIIAPPHDNAAVTDAATRPRPTGTGTRSGTYDTDTDIGRQVCFCLGTDGR